MTHFVMRLMTGYNKENKTKKDQLQQKKNSSKNLLNFIARQIDLTRLATAS